MVKAALARMKTDVEEVLDQMKPGPEPIPAVLVGGGSVLIDGLLDGTSQSLKPPHFGSANAIGAAIAKLGFTVMTGGGPADLTHVLATLGIRYLRLDQVGLAMASIVCALPLILPLVLLYALNYAIATALGISAETVKLHVSAIFRAYGVHSRTQAIARAAELHLLDT